MTIEEAISYLRMATDEADNEEFSEPYKEMCSMSIQALEKQIPKKPFQPFGTHSYKCSNCWKFVAHEVDDDCDLTDLAEWCPYCGQRLDWDLDS